MGKKGGGWGGLGNRFLYKQPHFYARLDVDMQIWQLDDI